MATRIVSHTLILLLVTFSILTNSLSQNPTPWVSHGPNGSLVYQTLPNQDRIMDFSAVGYKEGTQTFPSPPIVATVDASGKDDASRIQDAIKKVSSLPPDRETGLRGTVKLARGHFNVGGASFVINASGVVILGSGTDDNGTVLLTKRVSKDGPLFRISGNDDFKEQGSRSTIRETVPSGTQVIRIDDHDGFSVGDEVLVCWPQTEPWIKMMGMSKLWNHTEKCKCGVERRIVKIEEENHGITLDIPIPFRIDMSYLKGEQAYVAHYTHAGRIREVGLADFRAENEKVKPYGDGDFLVIEMAEDSWARNLTAVDFGGNTVTVAGKRITLKDMQLVRTIPYAPKGPKPADLALQYPACQVLVMNSTCTGDNVFNFITRNGVNGPNVFHNCTGSGKAKAQPHSHWATGLLYDNLNLPEGSIEMIDRSQNMSHFLDHGIAVGYGVAWHSNSSELNIINPPGGAANWAIGCTADTIVKPQGYEEGIIDPHGIPSPDLNSLYLAQNTSKLNNTIYLLAQNASKVKSNSNTAQNVSIIQHQDDHEHGHDKSDEKKHKHEN